MREDGEGGKRKEENVDNLVERRWTESEPTRLIVGVRARATFVYVLYLIYLGDIRRRGRQ